MVLAILGNTVYFVNGKNVGSENAESLRNHERLIKVHIIISIVLIQLIKSQVCAKEGGSREKPRAGVFKQLSGGGEDNEGDVGITENG